MSRSRTGNQFAALLIVVTTAACAAAKDNPEHAHPMDSAMSMGMAAPVIPAGARFVVADVRFMQGMIAHHGQAILMASMAASHGANPHLLKFTNKIDLSQRAEIELMQWWLRDRKQVVPDSGAHHTMVMPGMLTADQLKQLDAARGALFEKLFLEFMIQHHEGALTMVADLIASPMAAQEPDVYSLAIGIDTDQRAEILRMQEMLGNL